MPLLPEQYAARIAFFQNRISTWTSQATNIGTTTAAVTALSTAVTAATAALAQQQTKRDAAKTATQNLKQLLATMDNLGMTIVEQVRTKARSAGDGVYTIADLPAPATPQAKGDPGTPFDFKFELQPDGTLVMKWKCNNPVGTSGTIYQVSRRIGPTGPFEYLGGSGKREFIDLEIPAGATSMTYKIQAIRASAAGVTAVVAVAFGTNESGTFISAFTTPAAQLAA
jgi:hypothetical protein